MYSYVQLVLHKQIIPTQSLYTVAVRRPRWEHRITGDGRNYFPFLKFLVLGSSQSLRLNKTSIMPH